MSCQGNLDISYQTIEPHMPSVMCRPHATVSAEQQHLRVVIELLVARAFGVEPNALWRSTRGLKHIALARQVAMYLAHTQCGLSLTEVGQLFGRDRTTVAHGCLKIEDMRDDAVFDYCLDVLARALPLMMTRPDTCPSGS